ncbi:hypothetical protein MGMO_53c00730 [Methyloglobulus morosus KoM1]|uniref:Uncharacterized protein n=1 Tax=Methyloglobulus morosus KoM1 TaxID=1116472 RepID=V5BXQ2_9GAMM|nr:hypothetical protein MGMO_53c00730 [Methyloglobulus morosus KoM1]
MHIILIVLVILIIVIVTFIRNFKSYVIGTCHSLYRINSVFLISQGDTPKSRHTNNLCQNEVASVRLLN